jgi:hypothetical protein
MNSKKEDLTRYASQDIARVCQMFAIAFAIASLAGQISFHYEVHQAILITTGCLALVSAFFAVGLVGDTSSHVSFGICYFGAGLLLGSLSDIYATSTFVLWVSSAFLVTYLVLISKYKNNILAYTLGSIWIALSTYIYSLTNNPINTDYLIVICGVAVFTHAALFATTCHYTISGESNVHLTFLKSHYKWMPIVICPLIGVGYIFI